jgi:NTE family protein
VALQEGADVIIASYLAGGADDGKAEQASHALVVANRMVDILIRQNEKRNMALLRPQDILVAPQLQDVGFADFNRATEIVRRGQVAVAAVNDRWERLQVGWDRSVAQPASKQLSFDQREKRIVAIQAKGNKDVPQQYIQSVMSPLLESEFSSVETERYIDQLYTSGYFDLVSYSLEQQQGDQYTLAVQVREKPYSPHFMKTTLGFSSELAGVTQFSVGLGYRRPWLTESGLEFSLDARLGTQAELAARLYQPLSPQWSVETGFSWDRNQLPWYRTTIDRDDVSAKKLAYFNQTLQKLDAQLVYDYERKANIKFGWTSSTIRRTFDTRFDFLETSTDQTNRLKYNGVKTELQIDQLDSLSFPTRGFFVNASLEQGLSGVDYRGGRLSVKLARSVGPHIFNAGLNLARDQITRECEKCQSPTQLFLGGFQLMGAYRMGQLAGSDLAHVQGTYMYRLSDGGVFNQRTYVGTVLEAGDAWNQGDPIRTRYSGTLFVAVDSKVGDVYLGAAKGSGNAYNVFLQLGRRFSF